MAFKMKGFSGFGNSPVKQVKPLVNPKFKKFQEEKKQTRTVKTIKRDKPKTNLGTIKEIKNTTKRTVDKGKKQFTKKVRTNKSIPNIKIPKSIKRPPQPKKHKLKGLTGFEYDAGKYFPRTKRFIGDAYRGYKKAIDANKKFYKGVYDYFTKR
tara:strand:+ start:243 stop:701 length:459 start_codon:yes stop_codon:yes gene_type:complete